MPSLCLFRLFFSHISANVDIRWTTVYGVEWNVIRDSDAEAVATGISVGGRV